MVTAWALATQQLNRPIEEVSNSEKQRKKDVCKCVHARKRNNWREPVIPKAPCLSGYLIIKQQTPKKWEFLLESHIERNKRLHPERGIGSQIEISHSSNSLAGHLPWWARSQINEGQWWARPQLDLECLDVRFLDPYSNFSFTSGPQKMHLGWGWGALYLLVPLPNVATLRNVLFLLSTIDLSLPYLMKDS